MDKRKSRRLLCAAIIFFWASEYCHSPYFTPYLQSLGFEASIIGFITGIYGFTQIFARIPIGMVTDAFSCYKKTILTGTICTTLSSFFLMFATKVWSIVLCRVLAGFAASTWLAFTILYNAFFRDDESVTSMTNVNAFSNGGKLIAFFLGLATTTYWGYKAPLLCSFLTGIVSIVCVVLMKPVELRHVSFRFSHLTSIIGNPAIIVASLFAIVMQFYMLGTVFSFTSGYARYLGASAFMIGAISLSYSVVQVLIAGYIGKNYLKRVNSGFALCSGFLLLALATVLQIATENIYVFVLSSIFAGVGNIVINGLLMSLIVRSAPQEKQSTAMGFFQAVYGIGMTLGPVVIGQWISSNGYRKAYLYILILMAITAIMAYPVLMLIDRRLKK